MAIRLELFYYYYSQVFTQPSWTKRLRLQVPFSLYYEPNSSASLPLKIVFFFYNKFYDFSLGFLAAPILETGNRVRLSGRGISKNSPLSVCQQKPMSSPWVDGLLLLKSIICIWTYPPFLVVLLFVGEQNGVFFEVCFAPAWRRWKGWHHSVSWIVDQRLRSRKKNQMEQNTGILFCFRW